MLLEFLKFIEEQTIDVVVNYREAVYHNYPARYFAEVRKTSININRINYINLSIQNNLLFKIQTQGASYKERKVNVIHTSEKEH